MLFFFNDTATTEIYTLSLHDALPIYTVLDRWSAEDAEPGREVVGEPLDDHGVAAEGEVRPVLLARADRDDEPRVGRDRKSTRLNSSHANISYAVFCLKKKKKTK